MSEKKHLSILEFSRLTGIKRENLRFYDRIDLLKPESRGENGYRYYARRQLSSAYLIGDLRLLGVGLEDIRQYSSDRTPAKLLALLEEQETHIQEEIAKLREASEIMKLYVDMAHEALQYSEGAFLVEERKREHIFLCPPAPSVMSEDEGEILAYEYASQHGVNLGYPLGVIFPSEALCASEESPCYQYYFKAGKKGNAWKPAGLYAVLYGKDEYPEMEAVYTQFQRLIKAQNLEATGVVYAEFLLNEMAVQDPTQYFLRIQVLVTRK